VFERSEPLDFAWACSACAYGPGGSADPSFTPDIAFWKT
jgi:hypothetical protein